MKKTRLYGGVLVHAIDKYNDCIYTFCGRPLLPKDHMLDDDTPITCNKCLIKLEQVWNELSVICNDCATSFGRKMNESHIATFYPAICSFCKENKICTEPRDYRGRI